MATFTFSVVAASGQTATRTFTFPDSALPDLISAARKRVGGLTDILTLQALFAMLAEEVRGMTLNERREAARASADATVQDVTFTG